MVLQPAGVGLKETYCPNDGDVFLCMGFLNELGKKLLLSKSVGTQMPSWAVSGFGWAMVIQ